MTMIKPGTKTWTGAVRGRLEDDAPPDTVGLGMGRLGARKAMLTERGRLYPGTVAFDRVLKASNLPEPDPTPITVTSDLATRRIQFRGGPADKGYEARLIIEVDGVVTPITVITPIAAAQTRQATATAHAADITADAGGKVTATAVGSVVTVALGTATTLDRLEASVISAATADATSSDDPKKDPGTEGDDDDEDPEDEDGEDEDPEDDEEADDGDAEPDDEDPDDEGGTGEDGKPKAKAKAKTVKSTRKK